MKKTFLSKYITLLLYAAWIKKWKVSIDEMDLFLALTYLFSRNSYVNSKFLQHGLDLDRILSYFHITKVKLGYWIINISINPSLWSFFEQLDDVDENIFLVYLYFNLLNTKKVVSILKSSWLYELFYVNFSFSDFLNDIYSDNYAIKQMKKILKYYPNSNSEVLTKDDIERILAWIDDYSDFDIELEDEEEQKNIKDTSKKQETKLVLDTFGINLNKLAEEWKLEPVVWREKEINEVIYTLLRKTKNNPLLVWEAGVGKTAIVEGLAQKIVKWEVPEKLKNKKIYSLDMGTLVAGTKYRWEFEARLKSIIQEAINPENGIILFIDEIHTVIWAGNQEWWADTANLLKPYLARWELTVIWATTFDEYRKYIEKDPALTRRFQLIKIEEPSVDDAIKLLEWIKYRFEDFHGVNIDDSAVEKAVKLSKRYILDRFLPDKAIDLLDEAAARISTKTISKAKKNKIKKLEDEIKKIEQEVEDAVNNQDYFLAAELKEKINELNQKIYELRSSNDIPKDKRPTLTAEDIEKVIAEKYGISSKVLSKSEIEFLTDLENQLNKEIVWQEHAVKEIVNAIIRNKLSPLERNRPIGAFLFLWPSWVGKTYLATLLAKHFFQDEKALIKINMSEYSQDMASNKLTGSAPGYVGYEEWGILTEAVRKKPYSVVLFDEIEKWSPQILNILLQILDQWYLEDNKGRKIDFKNTIIILTSNLWSEYFGKEITKVWFDVNEKNVNDTISEEKKELIMNEVKNLLPLELINRLDKIVIFNPITKDLLHKIFEKYYKEYRKLWKEKKWITVPSVKKEEVKKLIDKIHKEGEWVRWIEKFIYNELENKVIQKLLKQWAKK